MLASSDVRTGAVPMMVSSLIVTCFASGGYLIGSVPCGVTAKVSPAVIALSGLEDSLDAFSHGEVDIAIAEGGLGAAGMLWLPPCFRGVGGTGGLPPSMRTRSFARCWVTALPETLVPASGAISLWGKLMLNFWYNC